MGTLLSGAAALNAHYRGPSGMEPFELSPPDGAMELAPWEWFLTGCIATIIICLLLALDRARRLRGVPLMTTRHLMVVVALAAVIAAVPKFLRWRSSSFEALARFHQRQRESIPLRDLEWYLLFTHGSGESKAEFEEIRKRRQAADPLFAFVDYHDRLKAKYTGLARHPWRFGEADPPTPPRPSEDLLKSLRADLVEMDRVYRSRR